MVGRGEGSNIDQKSMFSGGCSPFRWEHCKLRQGPCGCSEPAAAPGGGLLLGPGRGGSADVDLLERRGFWEVTREIWVSK